MRFPPLFQIAIIAATISCQTAQPPGSEPSQSSNSAFEPHPDPLLGYDVDAKEPTKAGRYEGWLVTNSERYAVSLDLLSTDSPGSYQGILSFALGRGERVGVFLDALKQHKDALEIENSFVKMTGLIFHGDDLNGQISTEFEEQNGEIFLTKRKGYEAPEMVLSPKILGRPVGTTIAGTYHGSCSDKEAVLQIETFPWGRIEADAKNWFDHQQVRGRIGKSDDMMCGAGSVCIQRSFLGARFFALDGKVELRGRNDVLVCEKSGAEMICDDCRFSGQVEEVAESNQGAAFPKNKVVLDRSVGHALPQIVGDAAGQYFGYLHHEARDVYQLVALNVKAEMNEGIITGEAVMTAYLGQGDSTEFSVFRFDDVKVQQEGILTWDGGADPILRIANWQSGIVRGYWFSKTYGRIGEFQLIRNGVPELPENLVAETPLSGTYQSEGWGFGIKAGPELADETTYLFPLRIFGNAQSNLEGARRRRIEDVRYDIYLGRLGMVFDDGRLVTGERRDSGFELIWPPGPRFGQKITQLEGTEFRMTPEVKTQARR